MKKSSVVIRPAGKSDMPAIRALIRRYPRKLLQHPLPFWKDFFVAYVSGKIVGCCALEVYSKKIAEVRSLVVAPQARRQGIGRRLVAECLKVGRRQKVREILVITASEKLFKKIGFRTFNEQRTALLKVLR